MPGIVVMIIVSTLSLLSLLYLLYLLVMIVAGMTVIGGALFVSVIMRVRIATTTVNVTVVL